MIDRRNTAFAIIRNPYVSCEVRHTPPSYSHRIAFTPLLSFQLHSNCLALHQFTLEEKKKAARGEGPGFDGELNNFQSPQLSSLAKLVSIPFLFGYCCCLPLMGAVIRT
jgi:hypothetical protein